MNAQRRVMLLIDADNVSGPVIEQAIAKVMADHGAIHVRRAYCTAESAVTHQKLFKAHSIRPIVNLSSGKNANDIALAVDAMDLAVIERPDVAVIVSSDSDFAPLVIRLREKGCRVEGIGQQGKTGEDSKAVYDAFVDLSHKKPAPAPSPRRRQAPAKRTAVAQTNPLPAEPIDKPIEPVGEKVGEKASRRSRRSRR
ncbi:MAG: NYN domain-containing protein [Rhizobacter sp.]